MKIQSQGHGWWKGQQEADPSLLWLRPRGASFVFQLSLFQADFAQFFPFKVILEGGCFLNLDLPIWKSFMENEHTQA